MKSTLTLLTALLLAPLAVLHAADVPRSVTELWADFDPRKDPLETEILKAWEQDGVVCRTVRYQVGVFRGAPARVAAFYAFPKGGARLPALLSMHGGGQSAGLDDVVTNAKHGYASIAINWGGNKLNFGRTQVTYDGPQTDWGRLDATHPPKRRKSWGSFTPDDYTLDRVESPRNSNWFVVLMAARRAITFLEQQPEVDPTRIGAYGHSMGGKLTTDLAGIDTRVKAAVPSCGALPISVPPTAPPEPARPGLRAAAADLLRRRWAWGLLAAGVILAGCLLFILRHTPPEPQSRSKAAEPATPARKEEDAVTPAVASKTLVSTAIKGKEPEPPKPKPKEPAPAQAVAAAYTAFKLGVEKLEKEFRHGDAMSACTEFMDAHTATREAEKALAVLNDLRRELVSIRDGHARRFKQAIERGDLKGAQDVIAELARHKAPEVSQDIDGMQKEIKATEEKLTKWPFDEATAKWRQRVAAEARGLAIELDVDLGNGVKMALVLIPPGSFLMGSEAGDATERPAHRVTFAKPFYMGKHEVTQRQWEAVMGANPSKFRHADKPVEYVSWDNCRGLLTQLNKRTGRKFGLPSEAEWEYACRAGASTAYCFGQGWAGLPDYAWFLTNSGATTQPVGTRKPNAWGLHDMHGNVWEWCEDVWHKTYAGAPGDGSAWLAGGVRAGRVMRGGSWDFLPDSCRSAFRRGDFATARSYSLGCRVVLRVP